MPDRLAALGAFSIAGHKDHLRHFAHNTLFLGCFRSSPL
jgi:hypothetical protein